MATPTGVGTEELRRANLRAILRTVHERGPTTRAQLTKQLGLNRSTIGALTGELQALDLVSEEAAAVGGRSGRPSHLVVPRQDNAVVAIDVGVDRIVVALVALGGYVLQRRQRIHQRGEHDVRYVIESVGQMVTDVLGSASGVRCLGVGVAVPGAVRSSDGMVRFAPNLGWIEEPFSELLAQRLGRPVATGNDANMGALAEHVRGAAVGHHDVAYLSGSVGIGGGFLVGGEPLTGAQGYAGEVGHLLVDNSSTERCQCGNVGCWEMKVGEDHLLTAAGRLPGGGPIGVAEVIAAARAGEQRASDALDEVGYWLGVGLRAVINIFNSEIIVLGGSLAACWEAREEKVNATLDRSALMSPRSEVIIRPSAFGTDSPWRGAAELAFAAVLEDPMSVQDIATSLPRHAG